MPEQKQLEITSGPEQQNREEKVRIKRNFPDLGEFYDSPVDSKILDEIRRKNLIERTQKLPKQLENLTVLAEDVTINSRGYNRITVSFTEVSDPNFAGANVWLKGYGTGNLLGTPGASVARQETLPYVLWGKVERSPFTAILEKSAEEVIIGVEAYNEDGISVGIKGMPTIAITLL